MDTELGRVQTHLYTTTSRSRSSCRSTLAPPPRPLESKLPSTLLPNLWPNSDSDSSSGSNTTQPSGMLALGSGSPMMEALRGSGSLSSQSCLQARVAQACVLGEGVFQGFWGKEKQPHLVIRRSTRRQDSHRNARRFLRAVLSASPAEARAFGSPVPGAATPWPPHPATLPPYSYAAAPAAPAPAAPAAAEFHTRSVVAIAPT
ncbi:hypothetical protein Vafri_4405 [Volvox africanus]|uniref:Uncharacterized protein n=1 Tax=Volvox africanus TaxID=51714 RepID=A0A8J4AW77_9CHLO|nr:hypothetical protein Vafri_4405 [Volvox africanus]